MKKWLKLWVAVIATLWLMITSFVANNKVSALSKTVTVTLNPLWSWNSCTLDNFSMSWTVSLSPQTLSDTNRLTCNLYASEQWSITLLAANITSPMSIAASDIKLKTANMGKNWSLPATTTITTATWLDTARTIYSKTANTIWQLSGDLTISVDMPAWAPQWTYTSNLTLNVPNS